MKTEELYFFMVPQPKPKKPYKTRYRLTIAEAAERYPGAEPILSSKETRVVPDTPEEQQKAKMTFITNPRMPR